MGLMKPFLVLTLPRLPKPKKVLTPDLLGAGLLRGLVMIGLVGVGAADFTGAGVNWMVLDGIVFVNCVMGMARAGVGVIGVVGVIIGMGVDFNGEGFRRLCVFVVEVVDVDVRVLDVLMGVMVLTGVKVVLKLLLLKLLMVGVLGMKVVGTKVVLRLRGLKSKGAKEAAAWAPRGVDFAVAIAALARALAAALLARLEVRALVLEVMGVIAWGVMGAVPTDMLLKL